MGPCSTDDAGWHRKRSSELDIQLHLAPMSDGLCLPTQRFSFSAGLVSSDRTIFCLMMSVPFMCLYAAALTCSTSGAASFWPPCHLAQICEEFLWLFLLLPQHVVLPERSVGLFSDPSSSLEVSQCGQSTSFSKTLGSPTFFSFGNNGVLCKPSCWEIIFIP